MHLTRWVRALTPQAGLECIDLAHAAHLDARLIRTCRASIAGHLCVASAGFERHRLGGDSTEPPRLQCNLHSSNSSVRIAVHRPDRSLDKHTGNDAPASRKCRSSPPRHQTQHRVAWHRIRLCPAVPPRHRWQIHRQPCHRVQHPPATAEASTQPLPNTVPMIANVFQTSTV